MRARALAALAPVVLTLFSADASLAAGPPQIVETWATDVTAICALAAPEGLFSLAAALGCALVWWQARGAACRGRRG